MCPKWISYNYLRIFVLTSGASSFPVRIPRDRPKGAPGSAVLVDLNSSFNSSQLI